LANLYKTQVKNIGTSQENVGFIGHMYVSVFPVYISAVPGIHIIMNIQTVSRPRLTV